MTQTKVVATVYGKQSSGIYIEEQDFGNDRLNVGGEREVWRMTLIFTWGSIYWMTGNGLGLENVGVILDIECLLDIQVEISNRKLSM